MNINRQSLSIYLVLLSIFAASCDISPSSSPTVPTVTKTLAPPPTVTPSVTASPAPSPTLAPATGTTLSSENWEGTVLAATFRKSIKIWGDVFVPKNGYIMVEVTMRIKNLNPATNPTTILAHDLIMDEQGQPWEANLWGILPSEKLKDKDPFEISFTGGGMSNGKLSNESMTIEGDSILRFHYDLKSTLLGNTVTFKFEDLPSVPFMISDGGK